MTIKEKNDVLRQALDKVNYIATENAGNNPGDVAKEYDTNSFAFDAIVKVIADAMRADITRSDLPPNIYRYSQMKSMPRGIEMKEFVRSDGVLVFIGQYCNMKNAQPNSRPKRIYRIEVSPYMGDWRAAVLEDDARLVILRGSNKWNVAYAALGALRGILHKRCTATHGNRRRKAAALNPANPVNPAQNKEI